MDKKNAIKKIKELSGEYEIEMKIQPCCCKMKMEKVYDTFNSNYFYLCRKCGNIKNELNEVIK